MGTNSVAVITGASAGIGRAFARRLASDGYEPVLVARDSARLEELAGELRSAGGLSRVVPTDLSAPADLHALEELLSSEDVDLLVNNAGFGNARFASFSETPPDESERMIAVHITALTRLTRAALPGMLARNRGAIINVSSLSSFMVPRVPVYSGTKAYVTAFTIGLQPDISGTNVKVQALCPGWTLTEFHDRVGLHRQRDLGVPEEWWMTAEDCVAASLAGLQRGELVCVPGLEDDSLLRDWLNACNTVANTAQRRAQPASRYLAAEPAGTG
jgi:short-subunit dehydrogenase